MVRHELLQVSLAHLVACRRYLLNFDNKGSLFSSFLRLDSGLLHRYMEMRPSTYYTILFNHYRDDVAIVITC